MSERGTLEYNINAVIHEDLQKILQKRYIESLTESFDPSIVVLIRQEIPLLNETLQVLSQPEKMENLTFSVEDLSKALFPNGLPDKNTPLTKSEDQHARNFLITLRDGLKDKDSSIANYLKDL